MLGKCRECTKLKISHAQLLPLLFLFPLLFLQIDKRLSSWYRRCRPSSHAHRNPLNTYSGQCASGTELEARATFPIHYYWQSPTLFFFLYLFLSSYHEIVLCPTWKWTRWSLNSAINMAKSSKSSFVSATLRTRILFTTINSGQNSGSSQEKQNKAEFL